MNAVRFTLFFALYVSLLGAVAFYLERTKGEEWIMPGYWLVFSFLAVLTWSAFVFSWIGIKKGGDFSIYSTLGAMIVKLLVAMSFALIYLTKINVDKMIFVIDFISTYFFFSAFEMWALLTNLRHPNKSK